MSNTLVRRYTFGNLHIAPSSQEAYLLHGISARQHELVSLAKSQVEAQKEAARTRIIQKNKNTIRPLKSGFTKKRKDPLEEYLLHCLFLPSFFSDGLYRVSGVITGTL